MKEELLKFIDENMDPNAPLDEPKYYKLIHQFWEKYQAECRCKHETESEGPSHLPDKGWPEKNGGFP